MWSRMLQPALMAIFAFALLIGHSHLFSLLQPPSFVSIFIKDKSDGSGLSLELPNGDIMLTYTTSHPTSFFASNIAIACLNSKGEVKWSK